MNTYFFVRVRLGKDMGRRSFIYGPYVDVGSAEALIDHVPDLLNQWGINSNKYNLYVEEKYPLDGQWIKITTRVKISVDGNSLVSESG